MKTAQQFMPVPFDEDTMALIGKGNEPFGSMKPIGINLGASREKPTGDNYGEVQFNHGRDHHSYRAQKIREMICLRLFIHSAWIYPISPKKVKPKLSEKRSE